MPLYKVETHCHTALVSPCSHLSPEELVSEYVAAGYDVLITTDHLTEWLPIFRGAISWQEKVEQYFSGYRAVRRAAEGTPLVVLPAFELTYSTLPGCDFLVYGIDEEMLMRVPEPWDMEMDTFKRAAESVDALVFQAHPFRYTTPVHPDLVDGVEVYNGNPRHESRNHLAVEFARANDLLPIGGSDAHQLEDIARGGIVLPDLPRTIAEFVRLYRQHAGNTTLLTTQGDHRYPATRHMPCREMS
jgi:predicted metal-dependent phosphoesterase TrpH